MPIDVRGVTSPEQVDAVIEVYQDYSAIQTEIGA